MARVFIYQYNGDSRTRDQETVSQGTPLPAIGAALTLRDMSWIVVGITTLNEVATDNTISDTKYVIDLKAVA
jgi:hypothetical protein